MPVAANIAPITPSTPSDSAAMREGNRAPSIAWVHVWMKAGRPESRSRSLALMAAVSCCGLPPERTTSHVSVEGDCWRGRNIAGRSSSVMFRLYLPSSTMPTTWMRFPLSTLKYRPSAPLVAPNMLFANNRFTRATGGAFLSSCHVKFRPANNGVSAAWRYSGEMLNVIAEAATFDGLRSAVLSSKALDSLQQAACNGGMLTNPTEVTPGMGRTPQEPS